MFSFLFSFLFIRLLHFWPYPLPLPFLSISFSIVTSISWLYRHPHLNESQQELYVMSSQQSLITASLQPVPLLFRTRLTSPLNPLYSGIDPLSLHPPALFRIWPLLSLMNWPASGISEEVNKSLFFHPLLYPMLSPRLLQVSLRQQERLAPSLMNLLCSIL